MLSPGRRRKTTGQMNWRCISIVLTVCAAAWAQKPSF